MFVFFSGQTKSWSNRCHASCLTYSYTTVLLSFYPLFHFSVAGLSPIKNTMEYNISKAALDMVTKQFALELGPHQIRVNTVNFSSVLAGAFVRDWIDTTAGQNFKALTPMGKFIEVKEACGPVMYLLSEQSTMVNGSNQVVDGGLLAHIPV